MERAAQHEVRQVPRVLEGVRLGEHAAVGVPQQVDLAEAQGPPDRLHVLGHGLDRVLRRVLELLRPAGAALVDEHQAVVPRERQQVRQEVVVRGSRTAVDHDQGRPAPEGDRVDHHPARIHIPLVHVVDPGRSGSPLRSRGVPGDHHHQEEPNQPRSTAHRPHVRPPISIFRAVRTDRLPGPLHVPLLGVRLPDAQPQGEAIRQRRVRQVEAAARVEALEKRPVQLVAPHVPEAHQVEGRADGELEVVRLLDPAGELLGQRDVPSDVVLEAVDAVRADHEPELQRPEPPAQRDLPVAVVDDGAGLGGLVLAGTRAGC